MVLLCSDSILNVYFYVDYFKNLILIFTVLLLIRTTNVSSTNLTQFLTTNVIKVLLYDYFQSHP